MKKKFYISAIYTSPPTSMGGNTKILLELINNLYNHFDFVVFTTEPETFKNYILTKQITIIPIYYPFKKFNYFSHRTEVKYITEQFAKYFKKHKIYKNDYFYSCSDFAPDVLPIIKLKKQYKFKWIASLFLFIPSPLENLIKGYKFPFLKYIVYFFYQRYLFIPMLKYADLFLITNDYDRKMFKNFPQNKILAIYGGVNTEHIKKQVKRKIKYDAVFCSRLHPQKGIAQLLEIWVQIILKRPKAQLAILGNGEPSFENYLKQRARELGIEKNIKWFGFVDHEEKYKIYSQSKVLLHSTIYDNNGMVAAEALCTGLPVVLYDHDSLKTLYTTGCVKIPIGNKKEFSTLVIKLLSDKTYYNTVTPIEREVRSLHSQWKWKNRAKIFRQFLDKYQQKS